MFPINDLTVLIVTYKTNDKILEDCIKSIDQKSKIIIVEKINPWIWPGRPMIKQRFVHELSRFCRTVSMNA